mmetsp:Transcript_28151/g.59448  ORF Transcript_28151/g.59448 Transcript_28151/m.59448 type:complete len:430 (-) Transcript_28151:189-1478(-)
MKSNTSINHAKISTAWFLIALLFAIGADDQQQPQQSSQLSQQSSSSPITFKTFIGWSFFDDDHSIEASGLVVAPDASHLVGVSDDGRIFFLNLENYNEGHCMVDLSDGDNTNGANIDISGRRDFEGITIDPSTWTTGNKHVYILHEGSSKSSPYLFKISYEYDNTNGNCYARVVEEVSLLNSIPCLEGSNGIESLGLKTPSSDDQSAVFFVGIQDTGMVYEITSEGLPNGGNGLTPCYNARGDGGDGGDGQFTDVSATAYDGTYLWVILNDGDTIAIIDPIQSCTLAIYDGTILPNDEGLTIDIENMLVYVASDGQGDGPSSVAVYDLEYPNDLGSCLESTMEEDGDVESSYSCDNSVVCGATSLDDQLGGRQEDDPLDTYTPTYFPTLFPDSSDDNGYNARNSAEILSFPFATIISLVTYTSIQLTFC